MALIELESNEVEAVSGGAAGDVTRISGPGGTITRVDLGDGTTAQMFEKADGSVEYSIIQTPRVSYT